MLDVAYSRDEKILMWLVASLVLPYPITLLTIIIVALYFCYYKDAKTIIKKAKENKLLLLIALICLVVSICVQNIVGIAISVILFFIGIDIIYFREYVNKNLFHAIVEIIIFLSIIGVAAATMEQINLCNTVKGMDHFFDIQNQPNHRVKGFYFNANYFAMMLVFIVILCVYKLLGKIDRKKKIYYVLVAIGNLYTLYLTGGRVAIVSVIVSVLAMLLFSKQYKYFFITLSISIVGLSIILLFPGIIPRLSSQGVDVERRELIWKTAQMMVEDHFIFGLGPLGYFAFWPNYLPKFKSVYGVELLHQYRNLGISSQHAHTIFLEPLVSFGLIGSILFVVYFIKLFINWIKKIKIDRNTFSLMIAMVVASLIFCIVDFPILWIQTGPLLLIFLNIISMYHKEEA